MLYNPSDFFKLAHLLCIAGDTELTRASALAKLAALGLSADEIAAL